MQYRLRTDIHYCTPGTAVVFLDAGQGRYFGIAGRSGSDFRRLAAADFEDKGLESEAMRLAALGLVEPHPEAAPRVTWPPITLPNQQIAAAKRAPPYLHVLCAALRQSAVKAALKSMEFSEMKKRVEKARAGSRTGRRKGRGLDALAATHRRAGLLTGHADQCLARSLALLFAALGEGYDPRLVFGVRTNPFAAHCWIQADDRLLNDELDHVCLFTPILVL